MVSDEILKKMSISEARKCQEAPALRVAELGEQPAWKGDVGWMSCTVYSGTGREAQIDCMC